MLEPAELVLVALAAVAAGVVNALAGGGTLLTFPTLTALGIPALAANVTNTVALCPGHVGAAFAQRQALRGQEARLPVLLVAGAIGGIVGGALLLATGERAFRDLVPYLLLAASALLALQERVRAWMVRRAGHPSHEAAAPVVVALASIYGGYFGAGLGVVLLAGLGAALDDALPRLNALKQVLSLAVNVAAAAYFVFSDEVVWSAAAVMAIGALAGGAIGGTLAGRVPAEMLRRIVVAIGTAVALVYLVR